MNRATAAAVEALEPAKLDVLEISGQAWRDAGFRSYRGVDYPHFDICKDRLPVQFDLVIAEQVFEHIRNPGSAARNVRRMLRAGGVFLVTTPFLIKLPPMPLDLWRWSPAGLQAMLEDAGFVQVEVGAWGNRACVAGNFDYWPEYDSAAHSLDNEPDFPLVVWGIARRGN